MSDPFRFNGPRTPEQNAILGQLQSEVSKEATPLLEFVVKNAKYLVGIVLVLIVAIAATGLWRWHEQSVIREAEQELGKILLNPSVGQRIPALEKLLGTAPASMHTGLQLEIAIAALEQEDLSRAAAAYEKVRESDPNSATGLMAGLNQADILMRSGKYAEALAVLDVIEKKAPETLRAMIAEAQAVNAEQSNQLQRALAIYETIAVDNSSLGYVQKKIASLKERIAAGS